ncbi:MAG: MBL fold metallo-hydrolase, partial [Betaproteobacteria bacterium]|nr:MBL fold metallo-hydrolase [Betaproteobacteria bacterium]
GTADLQATRAYLRWLDTQLRSAAQGGLDLNEVLRLPVPAPYRDWAAVSTEYRRNVMHLYPAYEQRELQPAPAR